MKFKQTIALAKILKLRKRLRIIQGGTAAGKTIAILLILMDIAQSTKNKLISVVSESMPHLKRGAVRDFLNIMGEHGYYKEDSWNKTDLIYTFPNGSRIEFFSADQPGKVRGPRRDILFINEVNNIAFETYTQLVIRTSEIIYCDFNPVAEFFIQTEVIPMQDHDFLVLTYKDNEALAPAIVGEIESRKENKGFWRVYGEGLLGEVEGRMYTEWQMIDSIPFEARLERYGLDFGYHPDPVAVVAVYKFNSGIILDEVLYQREVKNPELASTLKNLPKALIIADSAEPKSIDELKMFGLNIVGAEKGADSVRYGVKTLQNQRISVTKRSLNLIKEYRNYFQAIDRRTNIPIMGKYEGEDHLLDASRYAICSLVPVMMRKEFIMELPMLNQEEVNPAL